MIRTTRDQLAIILGIFCITVFFGLYQVKKSDEFKINLLITEKKSEKANILEKTIKFKAENLIAYSSDYTYWDEMVKFIKYPDIKWATENIDASMSTYGVDYVWIFDADFSPVYSINSEGIDPFDLTFDDGTLRMVANLSRTQHFFIRKGSHIIEICEASVHPSNDLERKTEPQGYFFAGRLWSDFYLREISSFTESTVTLVFPDHSGAFSEVTPLRDFQIDNFIELKGFDKKPLVRVNSIYEFDVAHELFLKMQRRSLHAIFIYIFFISVFLFYFIMRIFYPLGLMSKSLKNGNSEPLRKIFHRNDEFGQLALLINNFFIQKNKLVAEINERKESEDLLRKLISAIEQNPATIIITGLDGKIEYVNPKFTAVSGYTLHEVLGKNPRFLKSGQTLAAQYLDMWNTISRGNVWRGEFDNKTKSGEVYYESVVVSPIFDEVGKITNFMAINEDITLKKRDAAIRNIIYKIAQAGTVAHNLFELIDNIRLYLSELIDVTNFYVALYDDRSDTFLLPHFQDEKDYFTSFVAGKTLTAYVLHNKKALMVNRGQIKELVELGEIEMVGESASIWLGVPLIIDDKAIGAFVVQSYDDQNAFTEKDLAMLEFVSHEISHTIQRIKAEGDMRVALAKAELSDKLKSSFLANMSHEIRTPLNCILGFTKLLNESEIDQDKRFAYSKIIKTNGDQLLSIINNLLDFSMIETGQIKMNKKRFVIEKIFFDIEKEFHHEAIDRSLVITVSLPDAHSETYIESDLTRVRQVLRNLVGNALKFTKKGEVNFGFKHVENGIEIFVKDTGIGIAYDFRQYVFESFQQADKTHSRKYGGNGLGLAISKKIVDMLGGKIRFESQLGKGSTFYVFIPFEVENNHDTHIA
jgi:PAS domain S-box-containing protein